MREKVPIRKDGIPLSISEGADASHDIPYEEEALPESFSEQGNFYGYIIGFSIEELRGAYFLFFHFKYGDDHKSYAVPYSHPLVPILMRHLKNDIRSIDLGGHQMSKLWIGHDEERGWYAELP